MRKEDRNYVIVSKGEHDGKYVFCLSRFHEMVTLCGYTNDPFRAARFETEEAADFAAKKYYCGYAGLKSYCIARI